MDILIKVFFSIGFIATSVIGFGFVIVIVRLFLSDKCRYEQVRGLFVASGEIGFSGLMRSLNGEIVKGSSEGKHHLVRAGIAKKGDNLLPQARLSDEAIRGLIEPTL